ncbi:hypothetical protein AAC387_Pa08g0774 [Persea americana]
MLKVLYWNYRGIANNPTKRTLTNLVLKHSPDLIFISEPMSLFSSTSSLRLSGFGFDTFHSNASQSTVTNVWCISKSSHHLSISISDFSSQHLSMLLHNSISGLSSLISGVYGSNNQSQRKELWKVIIDSSTTTFPWCVLGDFNATLSHAEKLSLHQSNHSSLRDFQATVLQAGLIEVLYSGNKFTWSNNRQDLSYVAARLNRALVNPQWMAHYPDPLLHHLPRISSDHSPILLNYQNQATSNAPFKFENKWLLHPSFFEVVKSNWETTVIGNPQFILAQKLKALKISLKQWTKLTFGNLHQNILAAEARVLQCQHQLDSSPSEPSREDLLSSRSELHEALKAQEIHWHQRSRIAWLKEGDQNTKFFHHSAIVRSSFNKINHISANGSTIVDPATIQALAVDYFSDLFKPLHCLPSPSLFQVDSPKVQDHENSILTSIPSDEEIKGAVFGLKQQSSPNPDGSNGVFFHFSLEHNWSDCIQSNAALLPIQENP